MTLHRGQIVDGLRVLGTLGEGATSQVYLVSDEAADGAVRALKLLALVGRNQRRRLVREAEVIARIRHPNVTSIHRLVQHGGLTGLLMEFVAGPTVHRWLQTTRPQVDECIAVTVGILHGLQAIHDQNLVHRDIKPSNVVLTAAQDGAIIPRLLDFGLVKDGNMDIPMTATGVSMGTPAYMAPEQIRDASKVDNRADLYSAGCVLFEMLAGERLLPHNDWWEACRHLDHRGDLDLGRLPADTPDAVVTALRALLQADPSERPSSAQAVIEALTSGFPDGHPVRRGELHAEAAGGRVASGLALLQLDALRPDEMADIVTPTWNSPPQPQSRHAPAPRAEPFVPPDMTGTEVAPEHDPSRPLAEARRRRTALRGLAAVSAISIALAGTLVFARGVPASPVQGVESPTVANVAGIAAVEPAPELAIVEVPAPSKALTGRQPAGQADSPRAETPRPAQDTTPSQVPASIEATRDSRSSTDAAPPRPKPQKSPQTMAPTPALATISVQGDAAAVRLVDDQGAPISIDGPVPPGRYRVEVRWQPGDDFVPSGEVHLEGGERATVSCKRAFFRCKA